jgi:uncharacterized LabA/DUF88 family protein
MTQQKTFEHRTSRVLVLVDESNVVSPVRSLGLNFDWLKLREFFSEEGRDLIEMVVYVGLPPVIPDWQVEREKKNKFVYWLRSNGFLVVTKDGSPADEGYYKANVDVVILVTGDADFAYLAEQLRRRGIRVEVASVAQNLGGALKTAANSVIDLAPLFSSFESLRGHES